MSLYSVKVSLKLRAGVAQRPIFAQNYKIMHFMQVMQVMQNMQGYKTMQIMHFMQGAG